MKRINKAYLPEFVEVDAKTYSITKLDATKISKVDRHTRDLIIVNVTGIKNHGRWVFEHIPPKKK